MQENKEEKPNEVVSTIAVIQFIVAIVVGMYAITLFF